ncbi:MAG: anhydro-N-acetylmuramic acid kinase, partial [Alphaproteobacteria bacterium]|nr:anhydro-N-acetylmuramic acid kinase [Alphaproteobacteria bacterium]
MENQIHPITTIGLASDTSIFGVDAAILETDGADIFKKETAISRPYSEELKEEIRSILSERGQLNPCHLKQVEDKVTQHHIETVQSLLERADKSPLQIDVIGFSGHTVLHRPASKLSIQIGDAEKLRDAFNIPVATRFYQTDLAAGGQGSPIFPTFFDAMTRDIKKPIAVVSVSGVTSITFLGEFGEMKAFDVGPGNVLIDLWMRER